MESKAWYLSKGVIGGILVVLAVAAKCVVTQDIQPDDVAYFGVGLGLLGIRFKQG